MTNNKQISDTIFSLIRSALWGEARYPYFSNSDTDWEAVYQELRAQTIPNIAVDHLCKADPEHKSVYLQTVSRSVSNWYKIMEEQQRLHDLLQDAHIKHVTLKGSAAVIYYPQPTYRSMGDIDILVRPENLNAAEQILQANEYEWLGDRSRRHMTYTKNGIIIELHQYFSAKKCPSDDILDEIIFSGLDKNTEVSIEGFRFSMLPSAENGMVLLNHLRHHMLTGLGMRQIIDWMLYVDQELTDKKWHTEFAALARKTNLECIAITTTRMCQMYLGLSDKISWCKTADDSLCEELLDYLLTSGNFGHKRDRESNKVTTVLFNTHNATSVFKLLQKSGRINWPAADKYTFLRPFAWIYQIIRYIRLGSQRKNPIKNLRADMKRTQTQEKFLHRLGIR